MVKRFLILMLNEAIELVASGVPSAHDVDKAMRLGANHPMGPLALATLEVFLGETGAPRFRPSPLPRQMVSQGKLGRKTGQGFFPYPRAR